MEVIAPESLLAQNSKDKNFGARNLRNYEVLIDAWKNSKLVSFIGAGASVSLGIGDWDKLIQELHNYVVEKFRITDLMKSDDLPIFADKLSKVFVDNNKSSEFDEIVFRKMEPLYNSTSLTLIKLIFLVNLHITTNFDLSIEKAYSFLKYLADHFDKEVKQKLSTYSIPDLPHYLKVSRDSEAHILYLHGRKGGKYILRLSDYEQFYLSEKNNGNYSKCIDETLKSFLKEATLLFIGFSFNDIRLKNTLFRLIAEIRRDKLINERFIGQGDMADKSQEPKHFLLVHDDSKIYGDKTWKDFFDDFERYAIYPIIYEQDNHIFLEHLFDYLKKKEVKA